MSRALHIEGHESLYHVLSRANKRREIFLADDDHHMFPGHIVG